MTKLAYFQNATKLYLDGIAVVGKSERTIEDYSYTLKVFSDWLSTTAYAEQDDTGITPIMITEFSAYLKDVRSVGTNTIRYRLICLHTFFKWCIKKSLYKAQPISEDDIPDKKRVELDLLTAEQIDVILSGKIPKGSRQATAIRNRAIVVLLTESGLRASELRNLRIGDLDFENGTITVTHGKGDKRRSTTFPALAREFVTEYLNRRFKGVLWRDNAFQSEFVFVTTDENGTETPFNRVNLSLMVKCYVRRLIGRGDIGAHDLRHAYASMLLTKGAKLEQIQQVLGHSSYATTVIYAAHLKPQTIPENLNSLFA